MNTPGRSFYLIFAVILIFCKTVNAQDTNKRITVQIDLAASAQVIDNIGASGCWFSESIGKYWPSAKKDKIAELLFSKRIDGNGKLEGIGLSAWRFNIGAGTFEQGDSSGIKDFNKRTDCFLNPDGSYDWNKQEGQRFFLKRAHDFGVQTLIAFSNSPPVQFTKNGLGFKTQKDYVANLRPEAYQPYANFLANVASHFKEQGINFDYISPVNEPQWDWSKKYKEADQEGSPWTNEEIFKVAKALNHELLTSKSKSKILISEAGMLNYLYGGNGKAARQIQTFFSPESPFYVGDLRTIPRIIAGHSYFTESNSQTLIDTRKKLADTVLKYKVNFWQSEYSMLGDGFKEGIVGNRTAMDCALFLSKVIHSDLTIGNATAWQFWNSYEPGSPKRNTRYYLIALQPGEGFRDGEFAVTKNLWALGHYSRFVRPGMTRLSKVEMNISSKDLLVSAFTDQKGKVVIVVTNLSNEQLELDLKFDRKKNGKISVYETTAEDGVDMKLKSDGTSTLLLMKPRSMQTLVSE